MNFREATQEEWNAAVLKSRAQLLTQSWEWGIFQQRTGRAVQRLINDVLCAQIITMPLPRGLGYFYIPRGPLFFAEPREAAWREFRAELRARAQGRLFSRIDPVEALSVGFPVSATQPQDTIVVDVSQDDDALLAAMHQKTRYNIRLAEKKGVTVQEETTDEGLAAFLALTEQTATRHDIQHEPLSYYRTMFEVLAVQGNPQPQQCGLKIFIARYHGAPLAVSVALFFGNTMTYAHGASAGEQKNVMAPYLLHWHGMQYAKAHGFSRYDFRGVAPENMPEHPWAGITRFKESFGGKREHYPQSSDFPYRFMMYPLYKIGALLKHKKF